MKLTRVAVRNLLSFAAEHLELGSGLLVVVGPNGAGKSNLVRLLALAGLGLEWLEERSLGLSQPGHVRPAQDALASYAAGRHRGAAGDTPLRLEVGIELDQAEIDDLACFMRAAVVSTALTKERSNEETIAAWADEQITAASLSTFARGTLVMEQEGSPDAPWTVWYEFTVSATRFRWDLAHRGGGHMIRRADGISSTAGNYEDVWTAITGSSADGRNNSLPQFKLDLLCRLTGPPVEAPLVHLQGGSFNPDLPSHRQFAELAGVPVWSMLSHRTYSLGWVLRQVFQRGLVILGEQFRGVATFSTPMREVGQFSLAEFSGPAPSFEPYALPLRLSRMKDGDLLQRERFRRVQDLFCKLASGRGVDLSLAVSRRGGQHQDGDTADAANPAGAQASVTVQVLHHNPVTGEEWELPIQLCGAGTWEALVIAEAIVDAEGKAVILDEPAANLHPGWQRLLKSQIREQAALGQFVLITHSPYLVPMDTEDDLYRLVRAAPREGATRFARVKQPIADARSVMRDYSMSADARALLFASGAVLLEGETELGALPLWFAKSKAARDLGEPESLHMVFYSVGGDTHFKAPLTLLAGLGIPWAIVCGGWLFNPQFRGNHIFRQVAGAGAGSEELQSFIETYVDDEDLGSSVTFEQATCEGAKHRIFTLAQGWIRDDKKNGIAGNESFEALIEKILPGQLSKAEDEVGKSKSRKGRWLAENNPCPPQFEKLYRDIVSGLLAAGMPSRSAGAASD